MEQMPHHREGIQNELDKAYDEGHRDNEAFDEAKVDEVAHKEYGDIGDKETRGSLSLEETVALLKENGYLDTSFEGKESHRLEVRPLSKEEAFTEYRNNEGAKIIVENVPYTTPKAETLDVMMMDFKKNIGVDDALAEMGKFGVRLLTYEELIQYGIVNPEHQKQKCLIGLGTTSLSGDPEFPSLSVSRGKHILGYVIWRGELDDQFRFPVVRK